MGINYRRIRAFGLTISLITFGQTSVAQQFSLYGTGTLWDSFENPSQKAFEVDKSRQFASNFLFPNSSLSAEFKGEADVDLKNTVLYSNWLRLIDLDIGSTKLNRYNVNENTYLLMLRLFKTVKNQRELGFSWQTRIEGHGKAHNQALIIFRPRDENGLNGTDLYRNYLAEGGKDQLSATDLQIQAYHQIGFTYREQYNKKLSYGLKVSYLSGIAQNSLKINEAGLQGQVFNIDGDLRSSYNHDEFDGGYLNPGFQNPGLSLSLSSNITLKNGWYVLTNIKDLGFIRWGSGSYRSDRAISVRTLDDAEILLDKVRDEMVQEAYVTPLNSKAEILINKNIGSYKAGVLLSKSLINNGGDIVLMNSYRYKALNLGLSGAYNWNSYLMLGSQLMIKSPNVEFFIGSDNLLESLNTKKLLTENDQMKIEHQEKGVNGASAYIGFALKFGRVVSHPQNENYIPGINHRTPGKGILHKLFGNRD